MAGAPALPLFVACLVGLCAVAGKRLSLSYQISDLGRPLLRMRSQRVAAPRSASQRMVS